jgi:hypothetical protein
MDGQRFDDLTRAFVANPGRRRLLRRLAGVALTGSRVRLDRGVAGAACPAGQVQRRGIGCVCRTTGRPPVNGVCPCRSNADCGAGRACCGGACIDVSADLANCGRCGAVCDLGSGISACCDGVCTQLFNNEEHCGACDVACNTAASERCFATNCCVETGGSCSSAEECCGFIQGFPELGPACCGGICRDTQRDEANCGDCDLVCTGTGQICGGGGAAPGECCGDSSQDAPCVSDDDCCFNDLCCNSVCTNVNFNQDHCNACFNACDSDEQCRLQGCCGNTGNSCMSDAECCFGCVDGLCA